MSDYDFRPGGSLKLKDNQEGVKKKRKKRKHNDDDDTGRGKVEEKSKKLKLREESAEVSQSEGTAVNESVSKSVDATPSEPDAAADTRTEAEKRFEDIQRRRMLNRVKELAKKSHKDRVYEFNKKLEALSEHHDIPKVGPG